MAVPAHTPRHNGAGPTLVATVAVLGLLLGISARVAPVISLLLAVVLIGLPVLVWRRASELDDGLQVEQLSRLSQAELALASAQSFQAAARELADHAIALLGARSAVVLLEVPGETIRVTAGDDGSVYDDGSRMRLLEVDGVPCGSIAVGARTDGQQYTERDERILDALGQGVSGTLHRLSLLAGVRGERRALADVLASSSDGIFSAGPEYRVRSWNPAMARITGLAEADVLDEPCCSVFRPLAADGSPRFGAGCPGKRPQVVEALSVRVAGAAGDERWLTCTWSPMSDGGYVVVARDVTEAKRLADQKASFVANISHELRTPLTPIKGFLETLVRSGDRFGEEDRVRIYNLMRQQAHRLETLVEQLLEANNLDDSLSLLLTEVVDWPAVAERAVELARRRDPARDIRLEVRRSVGKVVADERRAGQVLGHLLDNALTHTPPGSPVRVVVERVGGAVVTSVVDTGPGIAPGDRERVFEQFTKLEDHLTQEHGGVGLGLYLARRYADAMGGSLVADGDKGGGTAFRFALPTAAAARRAGGRDALKAAGPAVTER